MKKMTKLLETIPSYMYYLDGYFGVGKAPPPKGIEQNILECVDNKKGDFS
jgi:hypothetical protein